MCRTRSSAHFLKALALIAALFAAGCDPEVFRLLTGGERPKRPEIVKPPPRVCTMELRMLTARLVDAAGAPVLGATVSVRRESGNWKTVEQPGFFPAGEYLVFQDDLLPLAESGTPVTARFALGVKERMETYLLASDGCHFTKLAGPDSTIRTDF